MLKTTSCRTTPGRFLDSMPYCLSEPAARPKDNTRLYELAGAKTDNLAMILKALAEEWPHALAEGREEAWAKAGHAIVDYFAIRQIERRPCRRHPTTEGDDEQ